MAIEAQESAEGRREKVAFLPDAVYEPSAVLQRVGPAHAFIPFDKLIIRSIQEQYPRFNAQIIQMADDFSQVIKIITRPHINNSSKLMETRL